MTDETSRSQAAPADPTGVVERLALAEERLAFYTSFDKLIQDNIARSGELMRDALALREQANAEMRRAQAELARVQAEAERMMAETARRADDERRHFAETLLAIQEELTAVQDTAATIARRVGGVLGEIGVADFVPVSWAVALAGGAAASDEPSPTGADAVEVAADGDLLPPSAAAEVGAQAEVDVPAEIVPEAEPSEAGAGAAGTGPDAVEDEARATVGTNASGPWAGATPVHPVAAAPDVAWEPRAVMVLVHGVPRAAAALSLQRHLAGLAYIDGVEAREYAEGILRLQVTARRPLELADLRAWDGGADLTPVHVQDDVIEVRLPGALGF